MELEYINPPNMAPPRGYSHAVSVSGNHKTIYIGGQNAIDLQGNIVGKGSLRAQTEQALTNIQAILSRRGLNSKTLLNSMYIWFKGRIHRRALKRSKSDGTARASQP